MQENAKLYLARKAQQLDLERAEALKMIQSILEEEFPGKVRAKSLNEGVLKVITPSAAVASELRLRQQDLIVKCVQTSTRPIHRLHIQITTLN